MISYMGIVEYWLSHGVGTFVPEENMLLKKRSRDELN